MDWRERIRNLWVERAVWMRHYIISVMAGLRDLSYVATRLLRNGTELGWIISHFYGIEIGNQVENLLTQNVLLLSELVSTVKYGGNIEPMAENWNAISKGLIEVLLQMNPQADRETWEAYVRDQFRLQMDLVISLSKEQYSEGIMNFDLAYDNATKMARQMIEGIEKQFGSDLPRGGGRTPSAAPKTAG